MKVLIFLILVGAAIYTANAAAIKETQKTGQLTADGTPHSIVKRWMFQTADQYQQQIREHAAKEKARRRLRNGLKVDRSLQRKRRKNRKAKKAAAAAAAQKTAAAAAAKQAAAAAAKKAAAAAAAKKAAAAAAAKKAAAKPKVHTAKPVQAESLKKLESALVQTEKSLANELKTLEKPDEEYYDDEDYDEDYEEDEEGDEEYDDEDYDEDDDYEE